MNVLSRFLTTLTFAIPATIFAWWAIDRQSPDFWRWVPLSAGIGAFLTTLAVWPWRARGESSFLRGGLAGGVIGMVSHPVAAVVSMAVMSLLYALNLLPPRPPGTTPWPPSMADMLKFAGFWIFWWTVLAMLGIGWISAGIGAAIGCVCAGTRRVMDGCDAKDKPAPRQRVAASGLSLLIVVSITGIIHELLVTQRPARSPQNVVFETSAPVLQDHAVNPGDVPAKVVAGATLIGHDDPQYELAWNFTEHEFIITVVDGGLPPNLMYEFQLLDRYIREIRGRWSIRGKLLQLSHIRVDGEPAELPQVTLTVTTIPNSCASSRAVHIGFNPVLR